MPVGHSEAPDVASTRKVGERDAARRTWLNAVLIPTGAFPFLPAP